MWALLLFVILRAVAARDCNDYTAVKIVFTFDLSSSTNGPNFRNQLKVANAILTTLRKRTKFLHWGAVVFADSAATAYPMQTSNDVHITDTRLKGQNVGQRWERYDLGLNRAKVMLQGYQVSKTAPVTNVMEYILLLGDGGVVVGRDFNLQTYREQLFRDSKIVITSALLAPPGGSTFSPVDYGCLQMYHTIFVIKTIVKKQGTCRGDVSHHLFKSLTCPDIDAEECKKLAIKEMLSTDTVEVVQKRVSSLFGDLVTENNCRDEPPILPIAPEKSTNPEQTSTAKPDSQEPDMGAKEPDMGAKEPDVGSQDPVAGSKESEIGYQDPEVGSKEPKVGSQDPEASSKELEADESSFPWSVVVIGAIVVFLLIVLGAVCASVAKKKKVNTAEENQFSIGNSPPRNGTHRREHSSARRRHSK